MSHAFPALLVFASILSGSPLLAQSQVFVAGGRMVTGDDPGKLSISAGAEKIGNRGLSVGGDAVLRFGRTGFLPGFPEGQSYRQLVLSVFAGAHGHAGGRFEPFVHGGVSVVTDPDCCGPGGAWTLGGGANYWLGGRFGIRADARVAVAFGGEGGLMLARIGAVFRFPRC
jgi:hypothetical protein